MPPRVQAPVGEQFVAFPVTPEERARLVEIAYANERDLAGEVRWRLRRILREPPACRPVPEQAPT